MNVNKAIMLRVCDFICNYHSSGDWICKDFYQFLYNKDCEGYCKNCRFFDPGDLMKWMEGKE